MLEYLQELRLLRGAVTDVMQGGAGKEGMVFTVAASRRQALAVKGADQAEISSFS